MQELNALWVEPPVGLAIAFTAIVLLVCGWFIWLVSRVEPQWTGRTIGGVVLWLAATGLFVHFVIPVENYTPRVMGFLAASNLSAVVLAFSPLGTRLAQAAPIAALVGFQAFRLPLELILHALYTGGTLPVQMTYSGHNFDIVTGILALLVAAALWRGQLSARATRRLVWLFNSVGLALLVTVTAIAVLSGPLPMRMYVNDPPVMLPFHMPWAWIVPFCVSAALFGHLVTFRWLLRSRPG